MNNDLEYTNGCSEEFAELCALSTSGELSAEELAALDKHVTGCASCAALLLEYTSLAHVGMAKLAADREQEIETPFSYNETKAEERFVAALHNAQPHRPARLRPHAHLPSVSRRWQAMKRPALFIGTAALVLVCIGGAFDLGRRVTASHAASESAAVVVHTPAAPNGEKTELKLELAAAQSSLKAISERSADLEKELAELTDTKTSLGAQIAELSQKDNSDSASLASVTRQRDGLQQQLNDASNALMRAKDDLNRVQQDRQGALFRVATLETEVKDLHTELSASNNSAGSDEKFLAADRDIRELMGARQLYIADVFDVQNNGERSKPFGRVFYTQGKSLIFYAFDLEKQPGYREAKAFQAWGRPDSSSGRPISLGIFYMDNEQNRRWVVKSDNPDVLAQINAVFVTVEPHGGSQRPTSKPFLEAYLHSLPPNHP
ncbi:MAG TPA: hypothetical protein VGG72_28485 [Bryobacteraceae bacterium]|jgi:archaellum component FlaC